MPASAGISVFCLTGRSTLHEELVWHSGTRISRCGCELGSRNLASDGEQNIRDQVLTSVTILGMNKVQVAGGVVLNTQNEVAVVKNRDEFWSLPKGHIEEGEYAITAAQREIEEETGLRNLSLVRELGSYERYRGTVGGGDDLSEHRTIRMFLFTTTETTLTPQDSYNPEARWVSSEKVSEMLTHPKDKGFFDSIKDSLK